jgi:hypothetical protein
LVIDSGSGPGSGASIAARPFTAISTSAASMGTSPMPFEMDGMTVRMSPGYR